MNTDKIEQKWCPKCEQWVPRSGYKKSNKTSDGLLCWCVPCYREYYRKYFQKNKEKHGARVRRYEQTPKGRLATYKKGARQKDRSWELSDDQFYVLIEEPCYWCGGRAGGVDRVDSDKGYQVANCVSCCKICNIAKSDLTVEEFLVWVRRISEYRHGLVEKK